MTNEKGNKGSKYCIQRYIDVDSNELSNYMFAASTSLLSFADLSLVTDWISPLKKNNYYEYRDDFLDDLDLNINLYDTYKKLRDFWPKNGPQWDGLATVNGKNNEKGVILVEAKAHVSETQSDMKASSIESINKIKKALKETQLYMGIRENDWTKEYYQLANRIAYLYFMNVKMNIPTWLVLINFVDDKTYIPTNKSDWLTHYNKIFNDMGIKHECKLVDRIINVYPKAICH